MKARHKDTGEIIELAEEGIISCDGRRFCWYQVELVPEPIDDFKPSLPSGLDEAAIQAHIRLEEGEGLSFLNIFKAGAQWRDAQIPKLPDSIDEAAEEWLTERENMIREKYYPFEFNAKDIFDAFKAGTEWMARQGYTVDGTFHHSCGYPSVIELKTYLRDYEGADVIVQIRKKQ